MLLSAALCLAIAQSRAPVVRHAPPQRTPPANSLTRALGAFAASDVDRDGSISASEARAIPIGPAELAKNDLDGDGAWSREEFTLYYRGRLVADGQAVGSDLDAEVARIQALKRVRVVEEARKQSGEPDARPRDVEPARVRLEKALDDLERSTEEKKATPEDFRRLRNLVILSGRSVAGSGDAPGSSAAGPKMLQTLERIEKRSAAGQSVREDFQSLRTLVAPATPLPPPKPGAPQGPADARRGAKPAPPPQVPKPGSKT